MSGRASAEIASTTPLLIFPCNGNGIEALDCLGDAYRCVGFVDDTPEKRGTDRYGHPVLDRSALIEIPGAHVLAVPGGPASYPARRAIIDGLQIDERRFARVVHPAARVSPHAVIGYNVLIMAGVVITSNAVIGNHVCVLPNSVIHHDVRIGAWTLVGSNVTIAGNTIVGDNCYIASGASLMNNLEIGEGSLVGLASNVIRNVTAGSRVVGNPARRIP